MQPIIYCFGEVLFDHLPTGKIAGGAPLNVAIHLNNLGRKTAMISRVGQDTEGKELQSFIKKRGVSTDFIQTDATQPTGRVEVTLDTDGQPSYDIVQPTAWDFIELPNIEAIDVLVYGSLACRHVDSKKTLLKLLKKSNFNAFDVNLRDPFYTQELLLQELLPKANLVKVNEAEINQITNWMGYEGGFNSKMKLILDHFELDGIILTKGSQGASYLNKKGFVHQSIIPVDVKDTIGCGDALFAGFIHQFLQEKKPIECLPFAVATGSFVAMHSGGTPKFSEKEIKQMLAKG